MLSLNLQIAGMTKSPFPLFDYIMLGPLLALGNLYFGTMLPEYYLLVLIAVSQLVS